MSKFDKVIACIAWIIIFHQILLHMSHKSHWPKSSLPVWRHTKNIFDKLSLRDDQSTRHVLPSISEHTSYKEEETWKRNKKSKNQFKNQKPEKPVHTMLSNIPKYGSSAYLKRNSDVITNLKTIGIKCDKLINSNSQHLKIVQNKISNFQKIQFKPPFYKHLATKSCDQFKRQRGFITEVTQEEKNFPIAFGILMHRDIEVAERLLRAIYRPSNFYCIHIDAKSPKPLREAMSAIASCFDNVFLASQSLKVHWGYYTVFQADLICMDDLLKYKHWKYFINLAGSEFPLKTNLEMVAILKSLNGASSVSGSPFSKSLWKMRMTKTGKYIPGITLKKGSQHIIAHRKFISYIRTAPIALQFAEWLKNASHPHETFYNSLFFSKALKIPSAYNGTAISIKEPESIARFKLWKFHTKHCSGKWVRAICIFGVKELPLLVQAPHLFANKFHSDFLPVVLDCLESWLFDKIHVESVSHTANINVTFYSKLDYVVNKMN